MYRFGAVVLNVIVQFTSEIPPGSPLPGTGHAKPVRKISSSPEMGTVVVHVLVVLLKLVDVHAAVGEKVICAPGAGTLYDVPPAVKAMFEPVSVIVVRSSVYRWC